MLTLDLYFSVFTGDTCIVTYPDGRVQVKARLPIPYTDFARRVSLRHYWLTSYGPGNFHFTRKTKL